jgi:hypothetical protein
MLHVFIGYDRREPVAYHVLAHSILRRASHPVAITPVAIKNLQGLYTRERGPLEATEFSMTRFLVPYLSGYRGHSLFMDCDMLCLGDLLELYQLALADREERAVWVVQHDYTPKNDTKFLNQPQTAYPRKNWSSVMLFNNTRCQALTPEYVNTATGLALHRFQWLADDHLIGSLPLEWNWLVGEYPPNAEAKLLHYTLGGPWFRETRHCDHAEAWLDEWNHMEGFACRA